MFIQHYVFGFIKHRHWKALSWIIVLIRCWLHIHRLCIRPGHRCRDGFRVRAQAKHCVGNAQAKQSLLLETVTGLSGPASAHRRSLHSFMNSVADSAGRWFGAITRMWLDYLKRYESGAIIGVMTRILSSVAISRGDYSNAPASVADLPGRFIDGIQACHCIRPVT